MPGGLLSGWLEKRGGGRVSSEYRRRWFVLEVSNICRYYKAPPVRDSDKAQGEFPCENATVSVSGSDSLEVHVPSMSRTFCIRAGSSVERDLWLGALQAAANPASTLSWAGKRSAEPPPAPSEESRPRSLTQQLGVPHAQAGGSQALPPAPPIDNSSSDDDECDVTDPVAAAATEAVAAVSLKKQPSAAAMEKRAKHSLPPGRVRHLFKLMDKDGSGSLSKEELHKGFAKDFNEELAPHVMSYMDAAFDQHAQDDGAGGKHLTSKVFSRFYCEVLFRHADRDDSGTLQLAEVQEALKHMVKPDADGQRKLPIIAYPPEHTDAKGEVHLPIQWFWSYFSSMD